MTSLILARIRFNPRRFNVRAGAQHLAVLLLIGAVYAALRCPTRLLPLAYYDDGETLYHTLSVLRGKIPYRDDYNHHFMGYVLPFVLLAKLCGFSAALIREMAFFNQTLTAFGVYLLLLRVARPPYAIIGALLTVSAREPWVLGFFQQYQINLLLVYLLILCFDYLSTGALLPLIGAGLLTGAAFVTDQRAGLLLLIPLLSTAGIRYKDAGRLLVSFLVLPGLAALYLARHDALRGFVEQTLIFPTRFRSGSKGIAQIMSDSWNLYLHLPDQTPLHCLFALLGIWLCYRQQRTPPPAVGRMNRLLAIAAAPLTIMPILGGRDFDYYTITWLPWLSITAALGGSIFAERLRAPFLRGGITSLLLSPVGIALLQTGSIEVPPGYEGDGIREVRSYLDQTLQPEDDVYMWGYRLDLYVYLQRTSPFPFVNQILIHPDHQIRGEARASHIYPKYQRAFENAFAAHPPRFIVTMQREGWHDETSPADQLVRTTLQQRYLLAYRVMKEDFLGKECIWDIYERLVP